VSAADTACACANLRLQAFRAASSYQVCFLALLGLYVLVEIQIADGFVEGLLGGFLLLL
jgi:hypothetical protein